MLKQPGLKSEIVETKNNILNYQIINQYLKLPEMKQPHFFLGGGGGNYRLTEKQEKETKMKSRFYYLCLKSSGLYISVFQDRPDRGRLVCLREGLV